MLCYELLMRILPGFLLALVVGPFSAHQSAKPPDQPKPLPGKFTDVTRDLGVRFQYLSSHTPKHYLPETMGAGVALFDYDNDGRLDIFFVNGAPLTDPTPKGSIPQKTGPRYWNRLFHQKQDGTFEDVTEKAGLQGAGYGMGVAVGDYDNDAFQPVAPLVYHNDGHGRFTEVSEKIGLAKPGKGLGIAIADYDRDAHIDLFIANDSVSEFLYHNKGDGTFEEIALVSGVAVDAEGHTFAGMGVDFADYNNDGLPDLVITDLASQMYALYRNNGDGTFTYDSYPSGIGRITMTHSGWGVRFIDYDNDGWKDLLITQGHDLDTIQLTFPALRYKESMLLARNTGKGFMDVSAQAGDVFQKAWVGRGLAIGDIDNDGRLDAVVTSNDGALYVMHNSTQTQNHWLTLELVGHRSNRDGIGAEVKLTTAKGSQWATVTTAGSYLSSSDKRVHFGLGPETVAGTIDIRWPSGIHQTLKDVRVDEILKIEEPSARPNGKVLLP